MLTMNHEKLSAEVAGYVAADAVIQDEYWRKADNAVGGEGCFIGCLAHDNDPQKVEDAYGLPAPLVKICETVFEGLPADDARAFFAALPGAVGRDGKDLGRVQWQFLGQILRELPDVPENVQDAIDNLIAGMDLQAAGEDWPDAAAVYDAAYNAAHAAAYADAAAYAADHPAARAATYHRERDIMLELIRAA